MKSTSKFEAELHVLDVLGGERGQADLDAGQIDVAAAAELAFGEDFAFDLVAVLGEHLHLDRAVVNQHHVADADVVDEILVIHVHGMLLQIAFAADGEGEFLAGLQIQRHADVAGADGRALRVHHDADERFRARRPRRGCPRTTRRTQSCGAWDMFRRKMLTPASISLPIISAESVAGPRVEMIFVLRSCASLHGLKT